MPVVRRSDAPTYTLPETAAVFTGLASPSRGSRETSVWEVTFPPGEPGREHSLDREEIFVVVSGRAVVTIGDEVHEAGRGDALIAPAHQPLNIANPYDEPVSLLCVLPVGGKGRIGDGEPFLPPWAA